MDKLQPIIKQRFWILLGLCLILALFGFFKTQSQIVAATQAREDQLKAALAAIPSGSEPNPTYAEGLKVINDAYEKKIKQAIDDLFAGQMSRMTWPEKIDKELPKDPKGVPYYRSKDHVLSTVATRNYSEMYKDLVEELWKKAEPVVEAYVPQTAGQPGVVGGPNRSAELFKGVQSGALRPRGPKGNKAFLKGQTILYDHPGFPKRTWKQKVYIDRQAVPQKVLDRIPSPDQVWDCQEDIWFTELLFEAVRKSNKDADNALTSPVRMISKIELRGGSGTPGAAAVEGGEMGGESGMDPGMGSGMGMAMAGAAGAAGAGAMLPPPPTAFDPADVFGPDLTATGAADGGSGDAGGDASMGMSMAMGPPPALRWVGDTTSQPYRERGFYLSVIVNQQRIPDFLVNLCESAWPTKVLRFQMGPNTYKKQVTSGAGGMAYDPYGAGAFSEGAYGGGMPTNIGSSMLENFSAMGMGMGMGMGGMSSQSKWPGGPPSFAFQPLKDPFNGCLNDPDLVQLDIAGIITFYVSSEAAAEAGAPAVDTPSAPGGDAALLTTPAEGTTGTPAANGTTPAASGTAPAATGTTPAETTTPTTPPADNAAPAATPPANGTAPATENPATPPAATAPAEAPAATAPPATAPPAEPATPPPAP